LGGGGAGETEASPPPAGRALYGGVADAGCGGGGGLGGPGGEDAVEVGVEAFVDAGWNGRPGLDGWEIKGNFESGAAR
jgi:hypothetical protein